MTDFTPISEFKEFLINQESEVYATGEEICFQPKSEQTIKINLNSSSIDFKLLHYDDSIRHFRFKEPTFSKGQLNNLSKLFNFKVIPHKYEPSISMGSLDEKHKEYLMSCYGAITTYNNNHYLLIYAKRGSTEFEDNIVYVHGIWLVNM